MRENIKTINQMPGISHKDKAGLTLVYLGAKPVTEFSVYNNGLPSTHLERRIALELRTMNVPFYIATMNSQRIQIPNLFVAKNGSWLLRIRIAEDGDDAERGICYGYPKTAINNFSGETMDFREIEDSLSQDQRIGYNLFPFRISKKYWGSELDHCYEWCQILKEHNHRLYELEKLMDEKRSLLRQRNLSNEAKKFLTDLAGKFKDIYPS